jgi:hypothetical protein
MRRSVEAALGEAQQPMQRACRCRTHDAIGLLPQSGDSLDRIADRAGNFHAAQPT